MADPEAMAAAVQEAMLANGPAIKAMVLKAIEDNAAGDPTDPEISFGARIAPATKLLIPTATATANVKKLMKDFPAGDLAKSILKSQDNKDQAYGDGDTGTITKFSEFYRNLQETLKDASEIFLVVLDLHNNDPDGYVPEVNKKLYSVLYKEKLVG